MKSSIFTEAEFIAIQKRLAGDNSDPTGIYANRVRPKLLEIASWNMQPVRKNLHSLLEQERKSATEEAAEPMQEQAFEEFKQEIGY